MVNPTGYTALDLIGFTDKGTYANNANYVKNDLVHYSGSIWRCLVDDTTGITPAEGVNWTLFINQPSGGGNVEQMIAPIEQATASEPIAIGDLFIYDDVLYKATAAIAQGGIIDPGTNCDETTIDAELILLNSALTQKADSSTVTTLSGKAYQTDDTAEETLAKDDVLPFYDTSASAKRKMDVQKFGEQLVCNPNLVDNSWFTVNQRGANSYTNYGSNVYCYDRWIADSISNTELSFDDNNGLVATNNGTAPAAACLLRQKIEANRLNVGDVYTLSMLIKSTTASTIYLQLRDKSGNNVINSGGKVLEANTWTLVQATNVVTSSEDYYELRAYFNYSKIANDVTYIKAIKLEKGLFSTLFLDNKPDNAIELLKCQRYFQKYNLTYGMCAVGSSYLSGGIFNFASPVKMRTTPTITVNSYGKLHHNGSEYSPNNATIDGITNGNVRLWISGASTSFTAYQFIAIDGFNFDLSADL